MSWCPNCNNFVSERASRCLLCGASNPEWIGTAPSADRPLPTDDVAKLIALWPSLSRDERQCLMLHYGEQLSDAEIADVLGLGQSYVEGTLRAAQDRCAEELAR